MLGFEFVMLANHDKTWQKLSFISLEWSTLKSKTKKLKFGIKTNELQAGWFDRSKLTKESDQQEKLKQKTHINPFISMKPNQKLKE